MAHSAIGEWLKDWEMHEFSEPIGVERELNTTQTSSRLRGYAGHLNYRDPFWLDFAAHREAWVRDEDIYGDLNSNICRLAFHVWVDCRLHRHGSIDT